MEALLTVWERSAEFFSFEYRFATQALVASVLVGSTCALVGVFMVLRRMALVGDAAAHASLPGVCLGFLVAGGKSAVWVLLGAVGTAGAAGFLISKISQGARVRSDAAIGIVLASFFGLGIVLLSYVQNSPTGAQAGLKSFLFGNAAGVDLLQLAMLGGVFLTLGLMVILGWRALVITSFDASFSSSIYLPTARIHGLLLVAISGAVVVSIQAVGVVLVSAMMIIPANAALQISSRIHVVALLSVVFGAVAGLVGAYVSFIFAGVSTGPAMVVTSSFIFGLCVLARVSRMSRRLAL